MAEETRKLPSPPYVAFHTLLTLLDKFEGGALPQRVDRSYWGRFFSGGVGAQAVNGLRFLGLLDDEGRPTEVLERLIQPGQRKPVFREVLHDRYAPVFSAMDPSRATSAQLEEVFRKQYRLSAETQRKALACFVHAAQYADVPVSPFIAGMVKPSGGRRPVANGAARNGTKKVRPARAESASPSHAATPPPESEREPTAAPMPSFSRTLQLRRGGSVTLFVGVNWFEIDEQDRTFVLDLIDRFRAHDRAASGTAGPEYGDGDDGRTGTHGDASE